MTKELIALLAAKSTGKQLSRINSWQKSAFPTLTSSIARGGFTGSESSIIMAGWLHWAVHCHHLSIQLTFHHISNSLRPSV